MTMSEADRDALIERWTRKSSNSEQDRMERAERMVKDAIHKHPPFQRDAANFRIYAKGSYANETNVRQDSDVDVVVENRLLFYDEYVTPQVAAKATPNPNASSYTGIWTPEKWRTEVENALKTHFGSPDVDTSGAVAITVSEVPGSRPSSDVIPAFEYYRYDKPNRDPNYTFHGSKVFKKPSGSGSIINHPIQQLENGQAKNRRTGGKYKEFARALKSGENVLVDAKRMKEKPSYLMECLSYNVADPELTRGYNRSAWFRHALATLHNALLLDRYVREDWVEPNELKYLFATSQKWNVDDARELTTKVWDYLEYE